MALLAGAMCGVRNDSCSRKHRYAWTSHGMASESLSRGLDLFFAQEFSFFRQEHGPRRGSKQAKTDVLLTTVLGPLRSVIVVSDRTHVALRNSEAHVILVLQNWLPLCLREGRQRVPGTVHGAQHACHRCPGN